ncbi:unnamed protein product [Schistosoma margrebowiei]|uniref:Uncharacterized protein n=1 Tax=Schistosoma margrebowiei TaxID=48269 RepID=A0A183M1N3_9TREM|nr:unnamed protein product [Schistosoma margrebowiei]
MDISEAYPVEGSNPFILQAKCNIDKLSGLQSDNIVPNDHEVVTIPDDQEPDPIDEAQSPELNEKITGAIVTQNHWETEIYIEPNYPISNDNVPDMCSHKNSHNFDEFSCKNEDNISAESNDGQKSNLILLDVNFPNDPLSTNGIPNEFENNASEEPKSDLKLKVVHNHLVISGGFSVQCEKHSLNKFLLITLFRVTPWFTKRPHISASSTLSLVGSPDIEKPGTTSLVRNEPNPVNSVHLDLQNNSVAYVVSLNLHSKLRRPRTQPIHVHRTNHSDVKSVSNSVSSIGSKQLNESHLSKRGDLSSESIKSIPTRQAKIRYEALVNLCNSTNWPNGKPQNSRVSMIFLLLNLVITYRHLE